MVTPQPCRSRDPSDPAVTEVVDALRRSPAPRAPGMIVTIYGDVVVPRGGVLWMGSLIALCGRLGLSESLVRTAVSRLVAAERLVGERDGRRSYYRLAAAAEAEFHAASERLFHPPAPATGWSIFCTPDASADGRMGRLGPDLFITPGDVDGPGIKFRAEAVEGLEALPALAAALWPLDALAEAYRAILARFAPLLPMATRLRPGEALIARLLLVHDFRSVLLRDPLVSRAALPESWPGPEAQALFRVLYQTLSPAADSEVAASLEGRSGFLAERTAGVAERLAQLGEVSQEK